MQAAFGCLAGSRKAFLLNEMQRQEPDPARDSVKSYKKQVSLSPGFSVQDESSPLSGKTASPARDGMGGETQECPGEG